MGDIEWSLLLVGGPLLIGGGIAWGLLKAHVSTLAKKFEQCKPENIMTADKCRDFHETRQAATNVQLTNIEKMLTEMKLDRRKFDGRLGALSSKIDVLTDRWERGNG